MKKLTTETVESVNIIETTVYKEASTLTKLECNNCGGNLDILDKTHAKCLHCGQDYILDEMGNMKFDLTVDYGEKDQVEASLKGLIRTMTVFLMIALLIAAGIIFYNMGARN